MIIRSTIYGRYRLLPYLYQCFFAHWLHGDPVIRPLIYHYSSPGYVDLDDQYLLVGDSLLVAPILYGDGSEVIRAGVRMQERIICPLTGWWFDLNMGNWLQGGRMLMHAAALNGVPLFVRDGAVVTHYAGHLYNSFMYFASIELHVFCREKSVQFDDMIDDLNTRNYEAGLRSSAHVRGEVRDICLHIGIFEIGNYSRDTIKFSAIIYGRPELRELELTVNGCTISKNLQPGEREWLCRRGLPLMVSGSTAALIAPITKSIYL
jgi:alpha-glucosidase